MNFHECDMVRSSQAQVVTGLQPLGVVVQGGAYEPIEKYYPTSTDSNFSRPIPFRDADAGSMQHAQLHRRPDAT